LKRDASEFGRADKSSGIKGIGSLQIDWFFVERNGNHAKSVSTDSITNDERVRRNIDFRIPVS